MPPYTSSHLGDFAPAPEPTAEPQPKWSRRFWADWLERVGSVFGYSLATFLTTNSLVDIKGQDFDKLWPVLFLPTILSAIKGLLANLKDAESGASLLPAPPGPEVNPDADPTDGDYPDQPQDDGV